MSDDTLFSEEYARKGVEAFAGACGIGCKLIDLSGAELYKVGEDFSACEACRKLHEMSGKEFLCEKVHLYGVTQSERFGGTYIYFCPAGLTHFASPITNDGNVSGALIGGPVLMIDAEDYISEEIGERFGLTEDQYEPQLRPVIEKMGYRDPECVRHASELLSMVAAYASGSEYREIIEKGRSADDQNQIGEYVQALKSALYDAGEAPSYPIETERSLISAISLGNRSLARKLLNEILGHILFSSGGDLNLIKARVTELVVLLSRAAVEGGADAESIFGLNFHYINEIQAMADVEEICRWLVMIMNRFSDQVFNFSEVKHIDVIYKSVEYIKKNYRKKLTLDEVAASVYLSPSYFSKIFKDELGCNFNVYLNKVRIEKSKKLLLSDHVNIVDVSDFVGFEDQSYFSKVFKKFTGVTPGRYRETRGQIYNNTKE